MKLAAFILKFIILTNKKLHDIMLELSFARPLPRTFLIRSTRPYHRRILRP